MKKTIFIKLMGTYFVIIFVCLSVVGLSLSMMMNKYLFEQKEKELVIKGQDIAQIMKPYLNNKEDPHQLINLVNRSDLNLGTEVWLVDRKGLVIAAAANHEYCEGNALEASELQEMQSGKISVRRGESQYFKENVIRVTIPIKEKDRVIGAIIVYSPVVGINQAFHSIVNMILYAGILSLIIALLVGIILSRGISRPILVLAMASLAIAKGEKKISVPVKSNIDEIDNFAQAFNYMSDKIEENEVRMKDFVANVSHEVRTPLTAIKGFAEALIDNKGKNDELRLKYLKIINREADRLAKLVTDLLVLSKAENQSIDDKESIDILEFLEKELVNFQELAREKSIEIEIIEGNKLPKISFNKNDLKQIYINLIENAIKYSPSQSKVTIECQGEEYNNVRIKVKDQGEGIPKEDLEYIWDRFYRVDKARSRETGGTGLGLSIVKQLVEKNGGRVHVESQVGHGSVFSFTAQTI